MICPHCGEYVDDSWLFCGSCGMAVRINMGTDDSPKDDPATQETPQASDPDKTQLFDDRISTADSQVDNTASWNVNDIRQAPVPEPRPTKNNSALVGVVAALAVIAIAFFVYSNTQTGSTTTQDTEETVQQSEAADTTGTEQDTTTNVESNTTDTPSADTTTTPEPEPEPEVVVTKPEPEPEPESTHRYEVVAKDISWNDAFDECVAKGGHLATITSQDEMNTLTALADGAGLTYVWLGGYTASGGTTNSGEWITGEPFSYTAWYEGEPSHQDLDGTPEMYIEMWKLKSTGQWSWNDERDRPFDVQEMSYMRGKMGYICEYE